MEDEDKTVISKMQKGMVSRYMVLVQYDELCGKCSMARNLIRFILQ